MRTVFSWLHPSWFVVAATLAASAAPVFAANGFNVIAVIPLPGVAGRIDHLAYDPVDQRVFVAELVNSARGPVKALAELLNARECL